MAIKELQTRIALKYDSYANWTNEDVEGKGAKLVLLPGEIGICYVGDTNQESNVVPTVLFKVGDGTKTFKELPWASAKAADVYSWAKASDVVYSEANKTITFVKGNVDGTDKVITFNYVTLTEVKNITDGLTTRIAALEGKFSGENDVQGQIDALDGRLDAIEDAETGAVATAKAYADAQDAALKTELQGYADQAEADAKKDAADNLAAAVQTLTAADSALDGRLDVIEGEGEGSVKKALADAKSYAEGEADAAEGAAKAYTDEREAAIKTAYEKYADDAEQAAKDYADDAVEVAVAAQATVDAAQNTEIAKKLDTTTYEAYIAGKEMSDEALKAYADSQASAAQTAAISAAKTETEKQVKALADGAVATNAAAISAMDTAYKAADEALDGRLDTVEAKLANVTNVMDFRGAVTALPEVADYQNGDVIVVTDGDDKGKEYVLSNGAWVEFGNTDANSSAIAALQGRMDTAESDIDAAEKDIEDLQAAVATKLATETFNNWKDSHEDDHAKTATEITSEIATAVNGEKTRAEAAEKAINDKIGTLPSDYTTLVAGIKAAKDQADKGVTDAAAVAGRMTTAEGNITTLQSVVNGYTGEGSIKTAIEAAQNAADNAQDAADKAQGDVNTLADVVNNETTGLAATKAIADKNKVDLAALTTRVGTAESNITTLQGIVETGTDSNANLRSAITDLQTLTGTTGAIRQEIADAKKAGTDAAAAVDALAKGQVATNKTNIEDHETRIAAIEGDYLKAADTYIFNCGSSTTVVHEKAAN